MGIRVKASHETSAAYILRRSIGHKNSTPYGVPQPEAIVRTKGFLERRGNTGGLYAPMRPCARYSVLSVGHLKKYGHQQQLLSCSAGV